MAAFILNTELVLEDSYLSIWLLTGGLLLAQSLHGKCLKSHRFPPELEPKDSIAKPSGQVLYMARLYHGHIAGWKSIGTGSRGMIE